VLPTEISDLLNRAAIDSDPEIARFASGALYQLMMWTRRLAEAPPEIRPEAELRDRKEQPPGREYPAGCVSFQRHLRKKGAL